MSGAREANARSELRTIAAVRHGYAERGSGPILFIIGLELSAQAARLDWRPRTSVPIAEDDAASLFKLLDALDDSDDVQRVAANFEVANDVLESLSR